MTIKASKKAETLRVADQMLAGLREAIVFERGDLSKVRLDKVAITARHAAADPAPEFQPARIIGLRKKLGISQAVFANALNVSPETVRAWEQGKNTPGGPALRLLEIVEESPGVILRKVELVATNYKEHRSQLKAVHERPKAILAGRKLAKKKLGRPRTMAKP